MALKIRYQFEHSIPPNEDVYDADNDEPVEYDVEFEEDDDLDKRRWTEKVIDTEQ